MKKEKRIKEFDEMYERVTDPEKRELSRRQTEREARRKQTRDDVGL